MKLGLTVEVEVVLFGLQILFTAMGKDLELAGVVGVDVVGVGDQGDFFPILMGELLSLYGM